MNRKSKLVSLSFIILVVLQFVPFEVTNSNFVGSPMTFKTNGGGIYPDYGLYIAQYFHDIGIEIVVKVEEWTVFVGTLCITSDYDFGLRTFDFSLLDPDPTKHFSAESEKEYTGLKIDIPYVNESEVMIQEALSISNQTQRIDKYIEWQNLVLDKIIPVYPLFNERDNIFLWPNVKGFDIRWSLVNSLPYMSFDGYHEGQVSLEEINLAYPNWRRLNRLNNDDWVSDNVADLLNEPLIHIDPYSNTPLNTSIIDEWEMINETCFSFHVRDNLFWNPSFNVTLRTGSSTQLNASDTSSLMIGLKGEYSNGTNQKLTAKDVVFTLLSYSNPLVSKHAIEYNWIKGLELNQTDELFFNIIIDGKPTTPEQDPYIPMWAKLTIPCLPEFFLNSTSLEISETLSGIKMQGIFEDIEGTLQWSDFGISAFGAGKYMLDYYVRNSITVLRANPNWMNIGPIEGSTQYLNISTINIKVIPEDSEEKSKFQSGILDIFDPDIPFELPFEFSFDIQSTISEDISCLFFNLRRPLIGWVDNYVNSTFEGKEDYSLAACRRKAFCYAIDRNTINEEMNHRWYSLQHGLINEYFTHPYLDEIFDYEYNLDTAIEWLTGIRPITPTPTPTETVVPSSPTDSLTTISFGISFLYGILATATLTLLIRNRNKRNKN